MRAQTAVNRKREAPRRWEQQRKLASSIIAERRLAAAPLARHFYCRDPGHINQRAERPSTRLLPASAFPSPPPTTINTVAGPLLPTSAPRGQRCLINILLWRNRNGALQSAKNVCARHVCFSPTERRRCWEITSPVSCFAWSLLIWNDPCLWAQRKSNLQFMAFSVVLI